jgi:hypothetical protein
MPSNDHNQREALSPEERSRIEEKISRLLHRLAFKDFGIVDVAASLWNVALFVLSLREQEHHEVVDELRDRNARIGNLYNQIACMQKDHAKEIRKAKSEGFGVGAITMWALLDDKGQTNAGLDYHDQVDPWIEANDPYRAPSPPTQEAA